MQQKFTQEAEFRQERDFGQKIGATFEFLGAHWKPLGKCLLYFVLPVSLVMGVGLGLMMNPMWNMMGAGRMASARLASPFTNGYFGGLGLTMVGWLLAFVMLLSVVYGYTRLLVLYEPAATRPTPKQVWEQAKQHLGKVALAFLLLFGLYLLFVGVMAGSVGLLANSLGGWVGLLFLPLMGLLFYAVVPLALYFPVLFMEETSVWAALPRCYALVRGKWWSTAGVMFVAFLIQSMLTVVFAIPQYGVMFGKMLHIPFLGSDIIGLLSQCLYSSGLILTYPVSLLAALFQYFNLVERKEGYGLRIQVMSLGNAPAPTVANQHLRPDDEGEY